MSDIEVIQKLNNLDERVSSLENELSTIEKAFLELSKKLDDHLNDFVHHKEAV